jgi:hypothetical protein
VWEPGQAGRQLRGGPAGCGLVGFPVDSAVPRGTQLDSSHTRSLAWTSTGPDWPGPNPPAAINLPEKACYQKLLGASKAKTARESQFAEITF